MDNLKTEVSNQIKKLSNLTTRYIHQHQVLAKDFNLSKSQAIVLKYINDNTQNKEKVYQKNIEQHFLVRRSTATECLKKLESLGLIKRTVEKTDARLKSITLTPLAKKKINSIRSYLCDIELVLSQGITDEELTVLLSIMKKMQANLEKREKENV